MLFVIVGPYSVKTGQLVYVNDSDLLISPLDQGSQGKSRRAAEIVLRLFLDNVDYAHTGMSDVLTEVLVFASTATFGGDPTNTDSPRGPIQFGHGAGVGLVRDKANPHGCYPYTARFHGQAVVVQRGECSFVEKLMEAAVAGASGVIALTDDDAPINPSVAADALENIGDSLDDVAIVTMNREESALVTSMLDSAELYGNEVRVVIAPTGEPQSSVPSDERRTRAKEGNRVLYLNGHPLLNTRLMV